jgi:hypothetical protein
MVSVISSHHLLETLAAMPFIASRDANAHQQRLGGAKSNHAI